MTTRKFRVTLANLVNENRHVTTWPDRESAEQYKQNCVDWYFTNPDLITIEEIEEEGEPSE